jgi:YidC/Oxa1 family membrane protein insertase
MLASIFGQLGQPFFAASAWMLAAFYALVPNYAAAIALLTLAVMAVVFPITLRATRGMFKLQSLAPEMRSLQDKYRPEPGMSSTERQELRQRRQQELMRIYKENDVAPTGGCLPMMLQFPVFFLLYETIRGLVHTSVAHGALVSQPLYVSHASRLYLAIQHGHGQLISFGLNLAGSVRSSGLGWEARVPLGAIVLAAAVLQWLQVTRASSRSGSSSGSEPQTRQLQRVQKALPIVFAVIYITVPAGVNIYFLVSGLIRVVQQELIFRFDPHIRQSLHALRARTRPV